MGGGGGGEMEQPSSESVERKSEAPLTSALAPCAYGMGPNRHTITPPRPTRLTKTTTHHYSIRFSPRPGAPGWGDDP